MAVADPAAAAGVDGGAVGGDPVIGDIGKYRRGSDEYESLMLEWVIDGVLLGNGVLLGEWNGELWQRIQQHRP